jgi:hypothetical protein
MGPCVSSDRLNAQRHPEFPETVLLQLFQEVPLVVEQKLRLLQDGAPVLYVEDCQRVVEGYISRKADLTSRTDCMNSLITGSNSDFFSFGNTRKCTFIYSLSELLTIEWQDFKQLRDRSVSTCSTERRAVHCRLICKGRGPLRVFIIITGHP